MNGKTYHVITEFAGNQEERVAELTNVLRNCINPDEPLFTYGKKPILLVNAENSTDSYNREDIYIYVPIATDAQSQREVYA